MVPSKKKFSVVLMALFIFRSQTQASEIPPDNSTLIEKGQAEQTELQQIFKLLVWNIQKAESGEKWQSDFQKLASQNDVLLLQEGYLNSIYEKTVNTITRFLWLFATSFIYQGHETGVVIGTKIKPIKTQWLRSPGREPLLNSPKMAIISKFNLAQSHLKLLVANIHGINFVSNNTFYEHISQVISALETHQGPIIFAGDFNTWNTGRLNYLKEQCERLGLSAVKFNEDPRYLPLDHIYYRNLKPQEAKVLSSINSSDHYPLTITFSSN